MTVDNSEIVSSFFPDAFDGDTFFYTELLDRSVSAAGGNRVRMLRSFYHPTKEIFWKVWPTIRRLCDQTGCRAYTRLSPRSYAKVGKLFARKVVEAALVEHYQDMHSIYASACGTVSPDVKLWLWDVDDMSDPSFSGVLDKLKEKGVYIATIPSRQGCHLISRPFWVQDAFPNGHHPIQCHKDNPTNLYIPDAR